MRSIVQLARTAWFRAKGYYPITIRDVTLRCDPDHLRFWTIASSGTWEPHTFDVLDRFLGPDAHYCDVGAWIGPDVLYASKRCKSAYAFEPDRFAYEYLLRNLRLNRALNVHPFNLALGELDGLRFLSSFGTDLGDSMSSVLNPKQDQGMEVQSMRWSTWHAATTPPEFRLLKIDIEGGEFGLLPTMADYLERAKPAVYLSTHAPFLGEPERRRGMESLADVLRVYRNCLDEAMKPVPLAELTSAESLSRFRSFVFHD